jgi:hypothetical protein
VYLSVPGPSAVAAEKVPASALIAHVPGSPTAVHQLDCNGQSPVQSAVRASECTDIRGLPGVDNSYNWGSRFYDNGEYIGHDEPDATFLSTQKGSGDSVNWTMTLGQDPTAMPTDTTPGHDVAHWFELTPAPWLSMALCDSASYPQLPCVPESDSNAPAPCTTAAAKCSPNLYPGAGSAFMEMQFYPPGNAPFADNESCDNTHWCAALTIDSLECTDAYAVCNNNCEEPQNFAFIQTNGVPDPDGYFTDSKTLLMDPGDKVTIKLYDATATAAAGGSKALKVVIDDLTLHTSGSMQASAKNGFMQTSIADCAQQPYNFQPEYSTASAGNIIPWAALQTNISTEFETGHFEPCTSLSEPFSSNPADASDTGGVYQECVGGYETGGSEGDEYSDALCYAAGDTHPGYDGAGTSTPPNEVTGCQDNWFQNGDLDFDGIPYYPEWPTGATPTATLPSSFLESPPTSGGKQYASYLFQTDIALSESACTANHPYNCKVPPNGPGDFYPFWSLATSGGVCTFEFGNVTTGANDFSKDAEYGKVQWVKLGYPEVIGRVHTNTCTG